MDNNIVVRDKTEIAVQGKETDILSLYGVPSMLDKITQKEKSNLLNKLNDKGQEKVNDYIKDLVNTKEYNKKTK